MMIEQLRHAFIITHERYDGFTTSHVLCCTHVIWDNERSKEAGSYASS